MDDQYWYEMGNEAIILRDMSIYISVMICNTYGKSDPYDKISCKVEKLFDKLRCDLDSGVSGLYPREQHYLTLYPKISITQVFYGGLPETETNPYLPYPTYRVVRPFPKTLTEEQRSFVDTFKTAVFTYLEKVTDDDFINAYINNKVTYMKNINSLKRYLNRL